MSADPETERGILFHHINDAPPQKIARSEHRAKITLKPTESTKEANVPASFPPRPTHAYTRAVERVW